MNSATAAKSKAHHAFSSPPRAARCIVVSAPYANFMFNPADPGPSVCQVCWTWKTEAYSTCYPCGFQPNWYDVDVPITYSVDGEQMHHLLWSYKNGADARVRRGTVQPAPS